MFLDGPAGGRGLDLRRCPTYLRVVTYPKGLPVERIDALDQADDVAEDGEEIHAYRLVEGTWGEVFVRAARKRSRAGGRYEHGQYRHVDVPLELREVFRDRPAFIAWAVLYHARAAGVNAMSEKAAADLAQAGTVEAFREAAKRAGALELGGGLWRLPD